ncbi:hypothetical protein CLU79DRAFT_834818 [Phycomyces nitens]|nr:hypothetical protein CLU79DRAFT_834818 [Phycomyces nitens]
MDGPRNSISHDARECADSRDNVPDESWKRLIVPSKNPDFIYTSKRIPERDYKIHKDLREYVIEYRKHPPTSKTMSNSYLEKYIPFKSSIVCYDEYASLDKNIRFGKILEELDDIGGSIAGRHIECQRSSDIYFPITVGIEQIYANMPDKIVDYKLCGHVAYTRNALIVVYIALEVVAQKTEMSSRIMAPKTIPELGVWNDNTVAVFSAAFIQYNVMLGRPEPVGQLIYSTPQEKLMYDQMGERHILKQSYLKQANQRLLLFEQGEASACIKLSKYLASINKPLFETAFTSTTKIESTSTATPQHLNCNQKVFGGYIIRDSFEFTCTGVSNFLRSCQFKLIKINDIVFRSPIMAGDHVRTTFEVICSNGLQGNKFITCTTTETRNPSSLEYRVAAVMYATFVSRDPSVKVKMIIPQTNKEKHLWTIGHEFMQQTNECYLEFAVRLDEPTKTSKL